MDLVALDTEPLRPSQLAERYPAAAVTKWGGAVIHTFGGASKVTLDFDPHKAGFIWITIGNQRALVHKDELLYIARFAKGAMAL